VIVVPYVNTSPALDGLNAILFPNLAIRIVA